LPTMPRMRPAWLGCKSARVFSTGNQMIMIFNFTVNSFGQIVCIVEKCWYSSAIPRHGNSTGCGEFAEKRHVVCNDDSGKKL
jgi:hypothetical protein